MRYPKIFRERRSQAEPAKKTSKVRLASASLASGASNLSLSYTSHSLTSSYSLTMAVGAMSKNLVPKPGIELPRLSSREAHG